MNILSFDIEEWYLYQEKYGKESSKYTELDTILKKILDLLDSRNIKGTFFCLGCMAKDYQEVVRSIAGRGHEVGCHSNNHVWLNKMSIEDAKEDTRISVDLLQQCIGEKIKSYRAPAFSIGETNKWAFELLCENGIERDASVFPAARDFGGFPNFGYKIPVKVTYRNAVIKEFPVSTISICGKELAYSGGGYFRLFPSWLIKNEIRKADYAMTYFHLGDLMPETNKVLSKDAYESYFKEPGTVPARYKRYIKSNFGKKAALKKLFNIIETVDFINLEQADIMIDWQQAPSIIF